MSPAQKTAPSADAKQHGPGAAAYAGISALILLILFIFPGFLAGLLSKAGGGISLWENENTGWYFDNYDERPAVVPVEKIVLHPSEILMTHSIAIRRFYHWQFVSVGGQIESLDLGAHTDSVGTLR